jgi:hypothetical protein
VATFLHGLYCVERWGRDIMSLYLHNIWIHWAKDFQKTDFEQEGTDIHEAWLATCKRILRFNTDRKEEHALDELIIRLMMESLQNDQISSKEDKWNRIDKAFKTFEWKEYFIPTTKLLQYREDWKCFLVRLMKGGFSQQQNDWKMDNQGITFNSLPLKEF